MDSIDLAILAGGARRTEGDQHTTVLTTTYKYTLTSLMIFQKNSPIEKGLEQQADFRLTWIPNTLAPTAKKIEFAYGRRKPLSLNKNCTIVLIYIYIYTDVNRTRGKLVSSHCRPVLDGNLEAAISLHPDCTIFLLSTSCLCGPTHRSTQCQWRE